MRILIVLIGVAFFVSASQTVKADGSVQPSYFKKFLKLEKELEKKNWSDPHSLNRLGVIKFFLKKYAEAEELHSRALKLYEDSSSQTFIDISSTLHFLALTKSEQGKFQEAVPLFERNLTIAEKVYAPTHPCLPTFLKPLAASLREIGKSDRAQTLENRAKSIQGQCENPFQGEQG